MVEGAAPPDIEAIREQVAKAKAAVARKDPLAQTMFALLGGSVSALLAEVERLRTIRHGDPHMFGAVLGYELGEAESGAEIQRLQGRIEQHCIRHYEGDQHYAHEGECDLPTWRDLRHWRTRAERAERISDVLAHSEATSAHRAALEEIRGLRGRIDKALALAEEWRWKHSNEPSVMDRLLDISAQHLRAALSPDSTDTEPRCCANDTSSGVTEDHCLRCHRNVSVAVEECPCSQRPSTDTTEDTDG